MLAWVGLFPAVGRVDEDDQWCHHAAAIARLRCAPRVPLRWAGMCLDAAEERRSSRRARSCSGDAGVPEWDFFLVAMAGSFLGLFVSDEQRDIVHLLVGGEFGEDVEHVGDGVVQFRELECEIGDVEPRFPG